jgi:hypothetical protein
MAAERLLADPGLVWDRRSADLAEIAALAHTGERIPPGTDASEVLRVHADRLAFRQSVESGLLSAAAA